MFSPSLRREVSERLARAGCVAADEEAEDLLGAARDEGTLLGWVSRRERGEPLAWIVGNVRFAGRMVHVEPGVFVPRAQTAELAVRAAELLPVHGRAADLCTGSGAVAVVLAASRPGAQVVAADADPVAVACARRNGVAAVVTDMDHGFAGRAFDVVSAVAPYVPTGALCVLPSDVTRFEPPAALHGGRDGLDLVRRLVAGAVRILRPGGWLVTEIGGDQDEPTEVLLDAAGFDRPTFWRDADGDLRGVAARLSPRRPPSWSGRDRTAPVLHARTSIPVPTASNLYPH